MQFHNAPTSRPLSPADRDEAQAQAIVLAMADGGFWKAAEGRKVRVTRVVTYEGDAKWMLEQLGRSLPEGIRTVGPGCTIRVVSGKPVIVEDDVKEGERV